MSVEITNWSHQYDLISKSIPESGKILTTQDGQVGRLDMRLAKGKQPFLYGRAFVPSVVGCDLDWFIHSVESKTCFGIKCIVMPQAREECLRRFGILSPIIPVRSLKVVRTSSSKESLLVEIHEYADMSDLLAIESNKVTA